MKTPTNSTPGSASCPAKENDTMNDELFPCPICKCEVYSDHPAFVHHPISDCKLSGITSLRTIWQESLLVNALRSQLADAQAQVARLTAWTPVGERLPDKDTTEQWEMYLCKLNRYGEILVTPLSFVGGSWYSDSHIRYDEFVTDWRELPKS